MEEGNPAFDYLLGFVRGDWAGIRGALAANDGALRQFMLTVALDGGGWERSSVRDTGRSRNVRIDGRYQNPGSRIFVRTGHFTQAGEVMNLTGPEGVEGTVTLEVRLPDGTPMRASCTVRPGCNSFVKLVR